MVDGTLHLGSDQCVHCNIASIHCKALYIISSTVSIEMICKVTCMCKEYASNLIMGKRVPTQRRAHSWSTEVYTVYVSQAAAMSVWSYATYLNSCHACEACLNNPLRWLVSTPIYTQHHCRPLHECKAHELTTACSLIPLTCLYAH
jgi:hypothetical protein